MNTESGLDPATEAQLIADIEGERGPDLQEQALAWAEENGLRIVEEEIEEPEAVEEEQPDDELNEDDLARIAQIEQEEQREELAERQAEEMAAIEGRLGRTLTRKEQRWLAQHPPEQIPQFADQLAARGGKDRDEATRKAMVMERAEDAMAEREAEKPKAPAEPAKEADPANETREERVARMAAAAEVAAAQSESSAPETPVGLSPVTQEAA